MPMWVVAYDPADSGVIGAGGLAYWGFRHGSPLVSLPALWLPASSVPVLRGFSEAPDLCLIQVPNAVGPEARTVVEPGSEVPGKWAEAVESIEAANILLAIEFTYHTNWGTNGVQRLRILYESVTSGIPTAYAIPTTGLALRKTERRGDQNKRQRSLAEAIQPVAVGLVAKNRPVTLDSVKKGLAKAGVKLELGATAVNETDPKVSLFCLTLQDTYDVPCSTVQLEPVITVVPSFAKLAGCQLNRLYSLIDLAIRKGKTGKRLKRVDFKPYSAQDVAILQASPPPESGKNRNEIWDDFHSNGFGFPAGSWGGHEEPRNAADPLEHYSLHIPRLADLHPVNSRMSKRKGRAAILAAVSTYVNPGKAPATSILPEALDRAGLLVVYNVSSYDQSRPGTERWQNANERTYSDKLLLVELCSIRAPVKAVGRPRAMAVDRKQRRHVLATRLPMPRQVFLDGVRTNARYRNFNEFSDLLIFEDGVSLGGIWTENGQPRSLW